MKQSCRETLANISAPREEEGEYMLLDSALSVVGWQIIAEFAYMYTC